MERITSFTSPTVVWTVDDVDTDQVIPARFLKGTARSGWGEHLFADRRYDAEGQPRPEFPLNRPEAQDAQVLVTGRNFGCGSSREHAVWALQGFGFRAVVALSFADIFRGNALKNGLLPVAVDERVHSRLVSAPGSAVTVDLEAQKLMLADGTEARFPIDPFARYCLLNGIDELHFLLGQEEAIAAYERRTGSLSGGSTS
jgi:3-isopropylmalate/(R)-2-methylmalate dehydratase small subunit